MKTDKISSVIFESKIPKQRPLTENMQASIESLLLRMNRETEVERQGDYFVSTITNQLRSIDGPIFVDERRYTKSVPYIEQMKGFSVLKFGRTRLDIDNRKGVIVDYKKPFYKPWFVVLKKAEEVLSDFRAYFNDKSVVQKDIITLQELTPEGARNVKKMVLEVETKRLQELTAELEKEL